MRSILISLKKNWLLLLQIGVWLSNSICTFLVTPILYEYETAPFHNFIIFLSSAIIAVFLYPITKFSDKKYKSKWWLFSVLVLLLGVISFYYYSVNIDDNTVPYTNSKTVIGDSSHLLDSAKSQISRYEIKYGRPLTSKEIVYKAGGQTDHIWNNAYLTTLRYNIIELYTLSFLFFTIFIISVLQTFKN